MRVHDIPTPALLIDADALEHNLADDGRRWPGHAAAAPRQGLQVHGAGGPAGRGRAPGVLLRHAAGDGGHGRRRARRRPAAGQRGRSTPTRLAAMAAARTPLGSPSPSTPTATVEAAAAGRRPRGADRRQRRPAPLRLRPRRRRPPGRPGPGRRASRCAASWATRATSCAIADRAPAPRQRRGGDGRPAAAPTTPSAARSCRAGGTGTYDLNTPGHRAPGRLLRPDGHGLRHARPAVPAGPHACWRPYLGRRPTWAVADAGLKALGMDHGDPTDRGRRRAGSAPTSTSPSTRARRADCRPSATACGCVPAHVDPTMAHARAAPPRRRRRGRRRLADRPPRLVTPPWSGPASRGSSNAARARNARPRWQTACFSSAVISANVRPSPSAGTKTRVVAEAPRRRAASAAIVPVAPRPRRPPRGRRATRTSATVRKRARRSARARRRARRSSLATLSA